MTSLLLTSSKYNYSGSIGKVIYVSKDVYNIFNLFINNQVNETETNEYSMKKCPVEYYEIKTFDKDKEINSYTVDMNKKIIINDKNEIVINFNDNKDNIESIIQLTEKKHELLKICKEMARKDNIPKWENNYYHIIAEIESNDNIKEDIDYLEILKEELEKY